MLSALSLRQHTRAGTTWAMAHKTTCLSKPAVSGRRIGLAVPCCPGDELSMLLHVVSGNLERVVEWIRLVDTCCSRNSTASER